MSHGRKPVFAREDSGSSANRGRNARLDVLSTRLSRIRKRADEPEHMFFCRSDLVEIWQPDDIRDVFCELRSQQRQTLKNHLLRFASFLVYIEVKSEWYTNFDRLFFQKPGSPDAIITDNDMPLSEDKLINLGLPVSKAQRWHEQYCFIPVEIIFNPTDMIQKIEDTRRRLPFMQSGDSAHGGYGDVVIYSLAPDCVVDWHWRRPGWKPPKAVAVAVKQFHAQKDGLLEAKNMSLLKESLVRNENISMHEAILTQGVNEELKVFIIFPRAPYGDLWQFLHGGDTIGNRGEIKKSYDFAKRFPEAANQEFEIAPLLLKQCGDLAGALKFLHQGFRANNVDLFCAHMDLKPNNIIIFDTGGDGGSVGMWKLCDFGISAFKEHPQTSGNYPPISVGDYHAQMTTMRTRARRDPGPYQAPEVWQFQDTSDLSPGIATEQGRVGRKSDIWSFGAIFSEVFAFALERDSGVKDFANRRLQGLSGRPQNDYFYVTVQPDNLGDPSRHQEKSVQVKPQVIEWLSFLCSRSGTPQRWAECWLGCIKGILQVDPDRRPEAAELERNVRHVQDHVCNARQPGSVTCHFKSAIWDTSQESSQRHVTRPPTTRTPSTLPDIVVTLPSSPTDPAIKQGQSVFSHPTSNRTIEDKVSADDLADDVSVNEGQVGNTPTIQSQLPLVGSQTRILGKPPDAHGIMSKPDVPRKVGSSKICELDIPRRKRIIAVAMDAEIIAYLTDSDIHVFKISYYQDTPNPENVLSIPLAANEPDPRWEGIAVSGGFLAVWGVERKTRNSLLRVVHITDKFAVEDMPIPDNISMYQFDHNKRVAVSARGFVAIIKSKELFVISYEGNIQSFTLPAPMNPSKGAPEMPITEREFIDVAFNDEGVLLYAWANVNNDGALCIYRCSDLHRSTKPGSKGYYKYDTSDDLHTTRLIPFNTSFGCIVASSNHLYFPAIVTGLSLEQKRPLQRYISKEIQDSNVKAACMFNDNSLVTVQKARVGWIFRDFRLYEYPLGFGVRHSLGHGVSLCGMELSSHKSSAIRVIRHNQILYACSCHVDGKVEFIPFYSNESTNSFVSRPARGLFTLIKRIYPFS
ncbi:kinase-like protein [Xylariaceae sp. FL0662B]|nr:kinase-like protein [Xylariaceae sp. FL0662B]